MSDKTKVWIKGGLAGVISGGAGGVVTGLAAIGVDPQHFNLTAGFGHVMQIAAYSSILHALLGLAMYLQKSPLPE